MRNTKRILLICSLLIGSLLTAYPITPSPLAKKNNKRYDGGRTFFQKEDAKPPSKYKPYKPHNRSTSNSDVKRNSIVLPSFKSTSIILKSKRHPIISVRQTSITPIGSSAPSSSRITYVSSKSRQQSYGAEGKVTHAQANRKQQINRGNVSVQATIPSAQFTSTSAMLAANTKNEYMPPQTDADTPRKKFPGEDSEEPMTTPIGDVPWLLMLLALGAYAIARRTIRKTNS